MIVLLWPRRCAVPPTACAGRPVFCDRTRREKRAGGYVRLAERLEAGVIEPGHEGTESLRSARDPREKRRPLISGARPVERKGGEPSTSALRTQTYSDANDITHGLTSPPLSACTAACTGNVKIAHGDRGETLETLVAALLKLSPGERAKLAALLVARDRQPPK